jgi:transmembrane protein TMEM260 (protein O-mannosyltransferase)
LESRVLRRLARPELVYPGTVFFVSLLLYIYTLAPTVTLVDSGELIVAARFLGVPHPPGFPLYIILAHLASLIPIGNTAQRIHFASALFAALAAAFITLATAEFIFAQAYVVRRRKVSKKKAAPAKRLSSPGISSFLTLAPALAAGLLVAFSRTLWSYATIAEVYTLNASLIALIFWLMAKWRRKILESRQMSSAARPPVIRNHDWLLYLAAGMFGLALGVHHVTVALTLPALALLVRSTQGPGFFASKRLLYAAGFAVVALTIVYSYLPMAASRNPIMNWGNPRSFQAIWAHITGRQYQVFFAFDSKVIREQVFACVKLVLREFGPRWSPIALGLAGVGFINLFKHDRVTFWFLSLVVVPDVAYGVSYFIAEDKDAYYLPSFIALAIAAAFGLRWLLMLPVLQRETKASPRLVGAFIILIVSASAFAANWPFNDRRHYFVAHDYVENIFESMDQNSLLLTLDWQVASPMFYTREVEHLRSDVRVVDVNLLRRLWYFDYLKRAFPELIARSRDKVDSFVAELREWDNDPAAYANDVALTKGITAKFQDMIVSFVTEEIKRAPVYVTNDLMFQTEQQGKELTQWLTSQYQLVPHGLVFKLEEDRRFHDPGRLDLRTRGLVDGTLRFEPNDVVMLKVLPAYKTMLVNRGRYFSFYHQNQEASEAFKDALALDPTLEVARQGLNDIANELPESR